MISMILFSKFSGVVPAFICARAIGNLWSTCLGVNILRLEWSDILSEKPAPSFFIGYFLLSKLSRTVSLPSKSVCKF